MICPHCKTRNPIGNKFCRECGFDLQSAPDSLAAEEAARVEAERREERVAELLAQAFVLSDQDKTLEALPLVEEATALLPSSTSALALLASLYERAGQDDKAIEALEKVIALNPGSAADHEKLQQLRRGVHVLPVRTRPSSAVTPSETHPRKPLPAWFPFAAAGAAGALVLGAGLWLLNHQVGHPQLTERVATTTNTPGAPGAPMAPAGSPIRAGIPASPAPPPAQSREDPFAAVAGPQPGVAGPQAAPAPAVTGTPAARAPRRFTPGGLPGLPPSGRAPAGLPPLASASDTAGTVPPHPVVPGTTDVAPGFGVGERIVVRPPSTSPTPVTNPDAGGSGSYIRIAVSPPGRNSVSAPTSPPIAAAVPSPAPAPVEEDPMLRAQSHQAAGRYRDAITAYQQAARSSSGAAAGEAYQGVALSEQRLGNDEAARAAYRQAIAAYEAQVAAGRSVQAAQRGIVSCKAALEVLGGG